MCEFCKKFDFGTATAKVDKYGASICFAGGFGRWVEKNGDGSDFQKAYGMALDALRRGGG